MRLRKKDWSSEVFEQFSDYLISDFEAIKGNWKETLKTDKLHVEIGAGKGDYWHQMSALYPERGIVAMERARLLRAKSTPSRRACLQVGPVYLAISIPSLPQLIRAAFSAGDSHYGGWESHPGCQ